MVMDFKVGDNECSIEQALIDWIAEHGNVCDIDTTNLICPRFIMTCDDIAMFQQAVDDFGALWVEFNDAGTSEESFMSSYIAALHNCAEAAKIEEY